MKQTELIALGLAAVAVFLIVNTKKKTATKPGVYDYRGPSTFETQGGKAQPGWQYFDDGTALDPRGNAWEGGSIVSPGAGLWL